MRVAVGVAIRSHVVEVLEARRTLRGKPRVTKCGRASLQSNDRLAIVNAIQGALASAKIRTKEAILAIPTQEVILRYFSLPLLPKHERLGAVQFEARKYIPFKLEELVWDFHLTEHKTERQLRVIFVATRKDVYADYMTLLQQAGLKTVAVEAASFSLARALVNTQRELQKTTFAAIDVSDETAHVALVHQGVPEVARDVFLVSRSELRSVEQLVQPADPPLPAPAQLPGTLVPPPPADEQIPIPETPTEEEQQFSNLLSELKLSLDYFAREFLGQDVEQVVVCGEQASEAWKQQLAHELKLRIELVRGSAIEGANDLSSSWMLTLGLALHGIGGAGPRVNFMKHSVIATSTTGRAQVMPAIPVRPVIATACVACLLLIGFYIHKSNELRHIYMVMVRLRAQREAIHIPFHVVDAKQLREIRDQMTRQLRMAKRSMDNPTFVTAKLVALPDVLPDAVWLTHVRIESKNRKESAHELSVLVQGMCHMTEKLREIEMVNQLPTTLTNHAAFMRGLAEVRLSSMRAHQHHGTDVTRFELKTLPTEIQQGAVRGQ